MRPSHRRLVGVLGLAFAIIVCGSGPSLARSQGTPAATPANPGSNATFATAPCPFPVPPPLVEGESLECGYLTTPLVHAEPEGERIRLFVIRLISPASDKRETPLVYLAGGPGLSGSSQLTSFLPDAPGFGPLIEQQDVILFDQRGTGFSEPSLYCPSDGGPGIAGPTSSAGGTRVAATPEPDAALDLANRLGFGTADSSQQVAECRAALDQRGLDLAAFSSAESAADIDDLRAALGYEQVDIYGTSYGSTLGFVLLREFPSLVRAAVLDSPLPPVANRFSGQTIAFARSLDSTIGQCEADPGCAAANPDLSAGYDRAVQQLTAAPLDVAIQDPATGQSLGSIPLDGEVFQYAVYQGLFTAPFIPYVPSLITAAVNGDARPFGPFLSVLLTSGVTSLGYATGLQNTILCTEENAFVSVDEENARIAEAGVRDVVAASGVFNVAAAFAEACAVWNLPAADPIETEPVVSDVPTLVIAGEFDPIAPPSYGELATETLANGHAVAIPGVSHGATLSAGPAGVQLVADFLADPTQAPDTSAVARIRVDFSPEQ